MTADRDIIQKNYDNAKAVYAAFGVDTESVIKRFGEIAISLHNWQGDDVKGFEKGNSAESQNVVTGNYKGAARNGDELRADIDTAFSFSPCKHRVNLHSCYAENDGYKPRNEVDYSDFEGWVSWAKKNGYGIDFNASFFTHPMMRNGFSLASIDKTTRDYWIKAGIGAREISEQIGKELKSPCINNIWIPDGLKDIPANRFKFRSYLTDSLDQILAKPYKDGNAYDVLEGKLFGIGTECFVVGSHDYYYAYALTHGCGVCMDTGHYHPTENVADKLSAVSPFFEKLLLHISRGIRWDSDHVLIQGDDLSALMQEMKRGELFDKVAMGLDYFDASINRVAAWAIGLRAFGKALLGALLEPSELLFKAEDDEDFTSRLALTDEFKNLPVNAVWDMLCVRRNVPVGVEWIEKLKKYEAEVQSAR